MFLCPKCHAKLEMDGDASGKKTKCPACGQEMLVPKMELKPGVTLGGFRIERKLGEGGMGEVFLARQKSLDRDVALKVLPPRLCRDKELVARFFSEVKVLARLNHPGIVTAYEAGEDGGMFFLAMVYVPGQSLQEQIAKTGAFDEKTALTLIRKMAQALDYAWIDHKLLHRDIKPANVLLDAHGEPKLVDFGLAIRSDRSEGLTQDGMVIGTPNYMSPEQIHGEHALDFRSDLYSLGAMLFHMLTGKMPYAGSSMMETLQKQMCEPLPDPRTLNPKISKGCVMLLQHMMAKKREQRPVSWKAFLGAVDRVLAGQAPTGTMLKANESVMMMSGESRAGGAAATQTASGELPRNKGVPVAAVTVGALVVLVAGLTIWGMSRPASPPPTAPPAWADEAMPEAQPVRVAVKKAASALAVKETAAKQAAALAAAQEKAALEAKAREAEAAAAAAAAKEAAAKEEADKAAKTKVAQDRFAAGLAEVADLMLKPDLAQAREKAAALRTEPDLAPLAAETEALAALMGRASDPDGVVLRSFERDKGETVKVGAKNGSTIEVRVLGISGGRIQTRQMMQGTMLERSLGPADLSVRERMRRIGDEKTPESAILRGLVLALEGGDWAKAEQAFVEAGPGLGEALGKSVQSKSASRAELVAHQALGVILRTASLPVDLGEPGRVMELLSEKPLSPETQEKVKTELESFLKTYGNSEAAGVARALAESVSGDPEVASKMELTRLLKLAGLKLDLEQTEALLDEIDTRGFGKDTAKIQAAAIAFKRDHDKSEIGQQAAEVVMALTMAQEKAPAPFKPVPLVEATEENIKKALLALQAANSKAKGIAEAKYGIHNGEIELELKNAEQLQDIRPLAGLPLSSLTMRKSAVKNFSPLAGMPLVTLSLCGWNGEKIEAFPNLPKLTYLNFEGSSIRSLLPFRRLKIRSLYIQNTMIDKLDGIEGFPLEVLVANDGLLEELSPLSGMPLNSIKIGSAKVPFIRDLAPLKDAPLRSFCLHHSRVKDLMPLAGKPITEITIYCSPISDLKPLSDMPLISVCLNSLEVTDLAPLKGTLLRRLVLYNLPVKELKPLAGCPLSYLNINNMPKLIDLQKIPDYFPDLVELTMPESLMQPAMIKRLKSLKKLTVTFDQDPYSKVIPLDSIKK